jgi:AAA+ ATPase superfamily predicted ATPase
MPSVFIFGLISVFIFGLISVFIFGLISVFIFGLISVFIFGLISVFIFGLIVDKWTAYFLFKKIVLRKAVKKMLCFYNVILKKHKLGFILG